MCGSLVRYAPSFTQKLWNDWDLTVLGEIWKDTTLRHATRHYHFLPLFLANADHIVHCRLRRCFYLDTKQDTQAWIPEKRLILCPD